MCDDNRLRQTAHRCEHLQWLYRLHSEPMGERQCNPAIAHAYLRVFFPMRRSSSAPLLFLGANGFPAKVYTPALKVLLAELGRSPKVDSYDAISSESLRRPVARDASASSSSTLTALDYHQLFTPIPKTWSPVVSHVESAAASLCARGGPIIAVGHSAGGALLLASLRNSPHLFMGVVMIDPPLFNMWKRYVLGLGLALPMAVLEKVHPLIKSAVTKRDTWSTMAEAEAWMESNRLFRTFHPDIRRAFLSHGLRPSGSDSSVTLAFTKTEEATMYITTPMETGLGSNGLSVGQYGSGGFPVRRASSKASQAADPKGVYFYSLQHKFSSKEDIDFMKSPKGLGRRADGEETTVCGGGCSFKGFEQGHFWPLEDPTDFGVKVAAAVESIADL